MPFPPPGDLPDPGIEPMCLASPALAGGFFTTEPLGHSASHHRKDEVQSVPFGKEVREMLQYTVKNHT